MSAPVPLPAPGEEDLGMPTEVEAQVATDAVRVAAGGPDGLTPLQAALTTAVVEAMAGFAVRLDSGRDVSPAELAETFRYRNRIHRTRILHDMALVALVRRPLPPEVATAVQAYADALGIDEPVLRVMQHVARGRLGLAMVDFERNGYTRDWTPEQARNLHSSRELQEAWEESVADPELAARWESLGTLAPGTLGRGVHDLYRARGFAFPGQPGSAPPLLAQHDWVHVLADYGTRVEHELEVFAFIGRADDEPKGFSLLAMVVGLFETGYLARGAGLFEMATGHLTDAVAVRIADAMRRGALARPDGATPKDFLAVDWFTYADRPVEDVRAAFSIPPKSDAALAAGSTGPWEPGGISPFQATQGRARAEAEGRTYDAFGATPD